MINQQQLAIMARAVHVDHNYVPAVIQALVESGDLPQWAADSAYLEPGSLEHECADLFHDGGITRIYFTGEIEQFPN